MATDAARTTDKSYWGKSREGEIKQLKFKTLFKYTTTTTTKYTTTTTNYVLFYCHFSGDNSRSHQVPGRSNKKEPSGNLVQVRVPSSHPMNSVKALKEQSKLQCVPQTMSFLFLRYLWFLLTDFNNLFTVTIGNISTLSPHHNCVAALPCKVQAKTRTVLLIFSHRLLFANSDTYLFISFARRHRINDILNAFQQ